MYQISSKIDKKKNYRIPSALIDRFATDLWFSSCSFKRCDDNGYNLTTLLAFNLKQKQQREQTYATYN